MGLLHANRIVVGVAAVTFSPVTLRGGVVSARGSVTTVLARSRVVASACARMLVDPLATVVLATPRRSVTVVAAGRLRRVL